MTQKHTITMMTATTGINNSINSITGLYSFLISKIPTWFEQ